MEWERFRRPAHLERMRPVSHVPHWISHHELRIHSREPCHEGICDHHRSFCLRLILFFRTAVASLSYTGYSRRHRLVNAILPGYITDSCVLRPSPRVCDGHCHGRVWRRWTGFRPRHPDIAPELWCTCHTAYPWSVELCDLCCRFLRHSAPSGV